MTPALILGSAVYLALALMVLALVLSSLRVVIGPTLADRVLALDQLVAIVIGLIAAIAIKTGFHLYIDIALALGLAGFLATVAFARYLATARGSEDRPAVDKATVDPGGERHD
jgi:multicomponent Na+:H+ antiporter subunit F